MVFNVGVSDFAFQQDFLLHHATIEFLVIQHEIFRCWMWKFLVPKYHIFPRWIYCSTHAARNSWVAEYAAGKYGIKKNHFKMLFLFATYFHNFLLLIVNEYRRLLSQVSDMTSWDPQYLTDRKLSPIDLLTTKGGKLVVWMILAIELAPLFTSYEL